MYICREREVERYKVEGYAKEERYAKERERDAQKKE